MAWIELHDTLPDHDKVIFVAEALNMDKDLVVGKLVRLWLWALTNREDGVFRLRDISTIAEVMRYKGKPQKLVDTLVEAKLLDRDGETLQIHDWIERVGMLLSKREAIRSQTRSRVQKHRAKNNTGTTQDVTQCNADCNALHDRYVTQDVTQCNAATVPKPKPYQDDEDDEDEDDNARMRTSEGTAGEYIAADLVVQSAIKAAYGRDATTAEVDAISRVAVDLGVTPLVTEAVRRAGVYGAKSVVSYVIKTLNEWRDYNIGSMDELSAYDYLRDCVSGKAEYGLDQETAMRRLQEMRLKPKTRM